MHPKRGVIHLLLPLLIVVILLAALIGFLITKGIIKKPEINIQKEASVELKTEYQNPFDKKSQFVNPFSQYKNPFDNLQ